MLFAAVAMTGVLGVVGMQTVSGPVTTITKVTQKNITDTDLLTNARVVVMNAATLPSAGDADGDNYVEPVAFNTTCGATPTGGGCLPNDIGAILTDPWGTNYGYCVWDHGVVNVSANRLQGEDSTSQPVIAVISAGADKVFQTSCEPFDGSAPEGLIEVAGSDDTVRFYTYEAAVAGAGGLWQLKSGDPTVAEITKDLEVTGGFTSSGAGTFLGLATNTLEKSANEYVEVVGGLRLDDQAEVADGECGAAGTAGTLRWNSGGGAVQVCDGTSFVDVGISSTDIIDDDGDTWIRTEADDSSDNDLIRFAAGDGVVHMSINSAGLVNIAADADVGGTLDVSGAATLASVLNVNGSAFLGDDASDMVSVKGNLGVWGSISTKGNVKLGDEVTDLTDITGKAKVGGTFDVTGAATLSSTLDVDGAMTVDGSTTLGDAPTDNVTVSGSMWVANGFVASGSVILGTNALNTFNVNATATFQENLTVNALADFSSTIQIGSGTCSAAGHAGRLQYTSSSNIQYCNGASWQTISGNVAKLDDIGDVYVPTPSAGQGLVWSSANDRWEAGGIGSGGISADSIDWAQMVDTMTLDENTTIDMDTNGKDITFDVDDSTLFIDSSANGVAIGSTTISNNGGLNLDVKLDVTGDVAAIAFCDADGANCFTAASIGAVDWDRIVDAMTLDEDTTIDMDTNNKDFTFDVADNTLHIDSENNRVGVGTNTPASTLDVNGAVRVGSVSGDAPNYGSVAAASIDDDSLDWDKFVDAMTLDADTTIDMTAGDINFDVNTFVIDSSADAIGIGVATPNANAALDINGTNKGMLPPRNIDPATNITGTAGLIAYDSTDNELQFYDGTAWQTLAASGSTDDGDWLLDAGSDVSTDLDVGIGTTIPQGALDVSDLQLDLGTGNCPAGYTEDDYDGDADAADCRKITFIADQTNGSVGIGTTPSSTRVLQVAGTSLFTDTIRFIKNGDIIDMDTTTANRAGNILLRHGGIYSLRGASNISSYIKMEAGTKGIELDGNTGSVRLYNNNQPMVYVTSTGTTIGTNVGAADASAALEVNSATQGFLSPRNADPATNIAAPAEGLIAYDSTDHVLQYRDDAGWVDLSANEWTDDGSGNIQNTDGGNVGIGKAADAGVELDVNGDIQYTGTITDVSDRRLKTDIHALDASDIIDRLTKVNTYTFHMIADPEGPMEYGVMAQELEEIFPELVRTAQDEMGTKSVNYVGLIAPLVEATKTLKSENDALRAEITTLLSQQDAMMKDIEALKIHTGYSTNKAMFGGMMVLLIALIGGGFFTVITLRKKYGA